MEYYYCKEDKYNNIHSIDNVIITYFLTCTLDFALGHIKMISDCSSNYWENLNVSRCSRYSYFNNIRCNMFGMFKKNKCFSFIFKLYAIGFLCFFIKSLYFFAFLLL